MVYLKVQPEEAVRRIRKRGREYEVKNDTDYWYTLSQNYNEFFYDYNWSKLLTIDCDELDFVNNENDKLYIHSFPVEKGGAVAEPDPKKDIVYDKPFEIDSKNTIIMIRGLGTPGVSGNRSWYAMTKDLEHRGFAVINSAECHDICSDKWMNQIIFERNKINTPKIKNTALLPKNEYTSEAFMIPIIGIVAIASRLVIERGIRFVVHKLTQRKKTHKTL